MGDPRKVAARMTQIRVVDSRDVSGGGTPGLGLTGLDVAAALSMGGANRVQSMAVMAKWVQDESAQNRLFYEVYDRVVSIASSERWRVAPGGLWLRKLTRLAIAEMVSPCRCRRCKGRGMVFPPGKAPRECPVCLGSTFGEFMPQSHKAELIGIPWESWRRTWNKRYARILTMMENEDSKGLAALAVGLESRE